MTALHADQLPFVSAKGAKNTPAQVSSRGREGHSGLGAGKPAKRCRAPVLVPWISTSELTAFRARRCSIRWFSVWLGMHTL
jgi:hypothetical protein